jgi:hypothetical protein
MKQKTEAELKANYDRFIGILKKYFTGDRLEKLLHMYSETELGGNLIVSPASGNLNYHNAYTGGYIDHIFNVCKNALRMKKTFEEAGGVCDFTEEELVFVALHHDLGKLGTKEELHYAPNDSEWHIKNKGEVYRRNDKNSFMAITDRTLYTLSLYQIPISENEYFGIKLTDGLYDEDNEKYFKVYDTSKYLRSNIQYIMHWADHMSTIIERQNYTNNK